jgi:hypothetical protein
MLFAWIVIGEVNPVNPAHIILDPRHPQKKGKTHSHFTHTGSDWVFLPSPNFTKEAYTMATDLVSRTPSRGLTLRQIIRIAAKGYEGSIGSWDHFIDDKGRLRKDAASRSLRNGQRLRSRASVHGN